jgi:hypothetical protein
MDYPAKGNINEQVKIVKAGLLINISNRKYLIRGIDNCNHQKLKANIKAMSNDRFHIDTIDLYISKHRKEFADEVSQLFNLEQKIIENDLNIIIERIEDYIEQKQEDSLEPSLRQIENRH